MAVLIGLWHRLILWVCLSLCLLRGVASPDHGLGSNSQYRRDLCLGMCQGLVGHLLPMRPYLESGNEAHLSGKKSAGGSVSTSSTESRRKGGMGVSTPDMPEPSTSSASSSSTSATFQVGMLFKLFDQWRSITSNRFVLNMVQSHHLQLRSCPLFHDFQCFNVKVAVAHHPVIQKEVDELLAKGAIEPYSCGAGFYSSMFVVLKHTGGLQPILHLKCFNHYMHIPSFKWQLLNMYGSLSNVVIMPFPLIYRMLIYIFPLLSIIIISYILFGIMCLIIGRFYLLGLLQPLGFLHPSPNLFCPFAIARVCILLPIWMTS